MDLRKRKKAATRDMRPVATKDMPKNAKNTTARKAYYTALASERNGKKPLIDRLSEGKDIPIVPRKKPAKGTVGSLKIAGMKAKNKKRKGI